MLKRVSIAAASICGLLFIGMVVLFGIVVVTSQGSAVSILSTGRIIAASANAYVSIESGSDTATIRTLQHEVVVAPTKITVDGQVFGTIPADAERVDFEASWTDFNVLADGVVVGMPTVSTAAQAMSAVR
jgi:hypothetical protein